MRKHITTVNVNTLRSVSSMRLQVPMHCLRFLSRYSIDKIDFHLLSQHYFYFRFWIVFIYSIGSVHESNRTIWTFTDQWKYVILTSDDWPWQRRVSHKTEIIEWLTDMILNSNIFTCIVKARNNGLWPVAHQIREFQAYNFRPISEHVEHWSASQFPSSKSIDSIKLRWWKSELDRSEALRFALCIYGAISTIENCMYENLVYSLIFSWGRHWMRRVRVSSNNRYVKLGWIQSFSVLFSAAEQRVVRSLGPI